jgi:hypothetical protein
MLHCTSLVLGPSPPLPPTPACPQSDEAALDRAPFQLLNVYHALGTALNLVEKANPNRHPVAKCANSLNLADSPAPFSFSHVAGRHRAVIRRYVPWRWIRRVTSHVQYERAAP